MAFVAKSSDIITESCTLSDLNASSKPSESRSSVATKAAFQSVDSCSNALKAHSLHTSMRNCPASPATTATSDSGSTHDEVASSDFSDAESCVRSTSCDADTFLADGSSSDCDSSSLHDASSQWGSSDTEASDEVAASCVYSVMLLLQLRAGALRRCGPSSIKYGARHSDELPCGTPQGAEDRKRLQGRLLPALPKTPQAAAPRGTIRVSRSDDEKVARSARSILNKLTVEKFDALHEQLATCGVKTPEQMALLMREIFEKATEQHNFSAMYADLCVKLEADSRLSSALGTEGEPNSFRRLLLGQCQSAFEKLFEPDQCAAGSAQDPELMEELGMRRKRRALGNVKLVGHLLVRGMLNSRLLVECADALLASRSSCPEALEALTVLLTVTGLKFDQKDWRGKERFDAIFGILAQLTKDKAVPPRVRFLLQDVLDLRRAGWKQPERAAAESKGPMRLEEVKRQAERGTHEAAVPAGRKPLALKRPSGGRAAWGPSSYEPAKTPQAAPAGSPKLCAGRQPAGPAARRGDGPSARAFEVPLASAKLCPAPSSPQQSNPMAKPTSSSNTPAVPAAFSLKDFHRELSSALRDLGADLNVVAAVRRIRAQNVPIAHHSGEFVDIITRAAEEKRGPARRSMFAFAAGLIAAEDSAFDRSRCIEGVGVFFREVYEELCLEVPRLQQIVSAELLPALKSVASAKDLMPAVPEELRTGL